MSIATLRRQADEAGDRPSPSPKVVDFRSPVLSDGAEIHALVAACPPLEENSVYCNLLQCSHFAPTCVVAEMDGEIVGWISAYVPPDQPDVIFVWQVAVGERARGQGLGARMLEALSARPAVTGAQWLKSTITDDNPASWAMFNRFAERRMASLSSEPWMLAGEHFPDGHESENLVTIGPLRSA
jgi:L-2,4-diaminobutyric acid acetyltransferase